MTTTKLARSFTLAIHPNSRGYGWTVFEGPFAPYDWGLVEVRKDRNAKCLQKAERMLERYRPETLVLEAFERDTSRAPRVVRLYRALISLAVDRGVDVAIYTRADVRACFRMAGAHTRQEIAEAVVRHVDAFRHRLPNKRRPWDSEDRRMALFSAAALTITHYTLDARRFLDGLRDAA